MRGIIRAVLAMGLGMGVLMSLSGGCVYHHDHEQVDVVDAQGYHHKGYYDENHGWHGGWTDEHNQYHDDPPDWHH
jgi:hypothetical protein